LTAVLNNETDDEADRPEMVLDDSEEPPIPHSPRPIVEHN
jgi:aerobic C4-dicarboxylate transport protein